MCYDDSHLTNTLDPGPGFDSEVRYIEDIGCSVVQKKDEMCTERIRECLKFINLCSKMCGKEIKVNPFLNLNFIRQSRRIWETTRSVRDRLEY